MKKILIGLLIFIAVCALVVMGADKDVDGPGVGVWQAYDQDGQVIAQLDINEQNEIIMYLYVIDENSISYNNILLNSMDIRLTDSSDTQYTFYVSKHDLFGLEEISGVMIKQGDILSVEWLNNGSVTETLPTEFHYMPASETEKCKSSRPLFGSDIEFPFSEGISPEEFTKTYGQPNETVIQEFLIGTNEVILTYDDFEIVWVHWLGSDIYSLSRFDSRSEEFCHKVKNISLGDPMEKVINSFMHDDVQTVQPLNGDTDVLVLYGEVTTMYHFGYIDDDKVVYAYGDKILEFEFTDNKLNCIKYHVMW